MKRECQCQPDACTLILKTVDAGVLKPGDRLVDGLADRFGVSRTRLNEALQRMKQLVTRDGRSLIVKRWSAIRLPNFMKHARARRSVDFAAPATVEEQRVLDELVREQVQIDVAQRRQRANRRFHHQVHLASHNRYLVRLLDLVPFISMMENLFGDCRAYRCLMNIAR